MDKIHNYILESFYPQGVKICKKGKNQKKKYFLEIYLLTTLKSDGQNLEPYSGSILCTDVRNGTQNCPT